MPPAPKKPRLSKDTRKQGDTDDETDRDDTGASVDSDNGDGDSSSIDTETEIALANLPGKSKQTAKRKRRAVSPTPFGRTLTALLETSTSTTRPLALRPKIAHKKNEEKLEMQARHLLRMEKRAKEEQGRIQDVIGGWGGESERALRKVAQRGVVKLFNVIQQVQSTMEKNGEMKQKLSYHKSKVLSAQKRKEKFQKEEPIHLAKDDFMELIRSGGMVSTT
ncbi:hypothetical protein FRB99_006997 [Tulasnella sp. 403]|nr:hypothetical protein FRB99_006997 [Tulasnella sp. 403]